MIFQFFIGHNSPFIVDRMSNKISPSILFETCMSFVKMLAHLTHCAYWYCWMLYISYILSLGASASSSFCWIRRLVPSLHSDHGGPVNRVTDGAKRRKRAYRALPRQHWAKETMDKNSPNSFWRERERERQRRRVKNTHQNSPNAPNTVQCGLHLSGCEACGWRYCLPIGQWNYVSKRTPKQKCKYVISSSLASEKLQMFLGAFP